LYPVEKLQLRTHYKALRAAIPPNHASVATSAVIPLLSPLIKPRVLVAAYYPHNHELNILPLLQVLQDKQCLLALPRITEEGVLDFLPWNGYKSALVAAAHGILIPKEGVPVVPDVVLVPLLAFTKEGGRLGSGKGYYDKTLAALKAKGWQGRAIGVGYDAQQATSLPLEAHDVLLDCVVTESRVW
jgi:5-formyltetrahydrofolate cyclo-ligase